MGFGVGWMVGEGTGVGLPALVEDGSGLPTTLVASAGVGAGLGVTLAAGLGGRWDSGIGVSVGSKPPQATPTTARMVSRHPAKRGTPPQLLRCGRWLRMTLAV